MIDDDDDLRRILRLSLTRVGGMEVREAASAADGLAAARADPPEVVLLDVMLPGSDGPALLQALRADDATRDVPVVFLTAETRPAEVARLQALGAAGVLTKPFDPLTLPDELRALIAGQRKTPGHQETPE